MGKPASKAARITRFSSRGWLIDIIFAITGENIDSFESCHILYLVQDNRGINVFEHDFVGVTVEDEFGIIFSDSRCAFFE